MDGGLLAYSPGVFNVVKLVHILAAIVWVGGGIFIQIYVTRLDRTGQTGRLMAFAKDLEKLGNRIFLPAALVVLIAGIVMVAYSPAFEVTQLWVILGLVGIANTIVIGAAFLGPEAGRLAKVAHERGAEDPEVLSRTKRIFAISRIDLAVILLVVADMVLKPGL
jgi:uncharacterized membrane protein